ncbi:putative vomeronasal receptor-like protein 4 [Arvicanthis niloticus]|uniref:putative vomeronasal receptor-like protein 4 n=1 Tax=Arvicanthis niloticus TaxID=61156 RepID=UPI00148708FF|nr:putative vomeronasal receptor-like protein 4 [Arvicanthis niloticus]
MFSLKNVLYFPAGLGVLANMFLLCFFIFLVLGHRPKPSDLISCQLTFIHTMMFLTAEDIWIADLLASVNIENNFKCKARFYLFRVMRGLSICTTCLLSVVQAVTISPSTSLLAKFKQKLKKYMIYVFFCVWSFNIFLSSNQIFFVGAYTNVSETSQMKVSKSCSLLPMNYMMRGAISTVATFRDMFLVGVMLTASTYMVIILLRHQRQCKHLHSNSQLRTSPEKRATLTILLLVVLFVVMYWIDLIISMTSFLLWRYDPVVLTVQKFVMCAYPTIAPLVQISFDNRIIIMLKNLQSKCQYICF